MVDILQTERMVLRLLRPEDRAEYLRIHEVSREHFEPWMATPPAGDTPERAFQRELDRSLSDRSAGTGERRVAELPDGRIAGIFGLSQIFRGAFLNAYAGWRVAADCIGRGLATEGVLALLDLAFAPEPVGLGLHRVQANVIPRNAASLRVAEKAGFRREGTARAYLHIAGHWQDHLMFAKTADEHELRYLKG
jgi:ribosomal-protein-alanine N-acetyltransferase